MGNEERRRGWFITFEGVDGSGKTSQLRLLAAFLRERGLNVIETREPGGTPIAEKIRALLLDPENRALLPRTEALLFAASRAQHVEETIRPALERGEMVLCDRYTDATLAYQGAGRGFPLATLVELNHFATGGLQPDLTFLLDLDPKIGRERLGTCHRRGDRLEGEDARFHERVREGYLRIAQDQPERVVVLDASRSVEAIQEEIQALTAYHF